MRSGDYYRVSTPEIHAERTRRLLATHPEVRTLIGQDRTTVLWGLLFVGLQLGLAAVAGRMPGWLLFTCAYGIGGTLNHSLWVVVHECTHGLVFRKDAWNRVLAIFANIAIAVPGAAMNFRKYHLLHHLHLGDLALDADLPSPSELRWVGTSPWRKALWLALFSFVQGLIRPARVGSYVSDRWAIANIAGVALALAALVAAAGPWALAYLLLSTFFALGLHPFGARWIQEHFVFRPGQETYSYYGPLNVLQLNVGYHNEHHDLMTVPWSRLPTLRRMAPELYDGLYAHRSYLRLLRQFIWDRRIGPQSRVVRPSRAPASRPALNPGSRAPARRAASVQAM